MRITRAGGWVAVRGDATTVFRSTKQHSKNAILIAQADFRGAVCRAVVPRKAPLDLRGTDGELVRRRRPDSDIDVLAVLETLAGDYGDDLEPGLAAVYPVALRLGRRVSVKPLTREEYEQGDSPLLREVRRTGVAA